jgi:formylglycine-generating enzyme required for sulfatase activity
MRSSVFSIILVIIAFTSCNTTIKEGTKIEFPYSQWTIGPGSHNISWHYQEGFEYNNSFIKAPGEEKWDDWYEKIKNYRQTVRKKAGKETPYLYCEFPVKKETKIHFDKFGYQLKLMPGEKIEISGKTKFDEGDFRICFDFDLKTKGEELSYVVREKLKSVDSLELSASKDWQVFSKRVIIPEFDTDSFAITPIIRIEYKTELQNELFITDIQLKTPSTDERTKVLSRINDYIAKQAENNTFKIPEELSWTHQNYVMGFVFIWDSKFWDAEKGEYLVDEYCNTMQKEFGGIQSVVLWHSYPNIGIDERNQFEMLRTMPGGIKGVKKVVGDFHKNGVKVFITYNPWDLDTHRPENHDFVELANAIDETGADGVYLDTWKCSKGVISIFEVENSIRDEVEKRGKTVAFATEILPELKDLYGTDALTSSWGQEIHPFNYTDLSHHKWLMPEHKQHYIKRMTKNRKPIIAHAWINGQGVQLWENIFGTMNLWNAEHRQILRKMNAIWKNYGLLYLDGDWKPFIPTLNPNIVASQWTIENVTITNFVDTVKSENKLKFEVPDNTSKYYDLWNGTRLKPSEDNGTYYVELPVNDFGCLLQTDKENQELKHLLAKQQKETNTPLPAIDKYSQELSLKEPLQYNYRSSENTDFTPELLPIEGGVKTFTAQHIWREGKCYPNMDAKDNHDLDLFREDGALRVKHTHKEKLQDYSIMPRVVTNGQFAEFLKATNYQPRYPTNFLKHWNSSECPAEIEDEPVVYVSLEDARAFAQWAGMRLPTEWEWQLGYETHKDKFRFNEVFEWNESERYDGFNRSVSLRGGCSHWITPSSWWYLPSAPYGEKAGGPQKYDSHVKYFLIYPGLDRASTIGFRCIKK